jgi:hypothetical protein
MNIRAKAILAEVVVGVAALVTAGIAQSVSDTDPIIAMPLFFVAFFLFFGGNAWIYVAFKCPNCGTSIFYRRRLYAAWPVRKCTNCGTSLTT